MERVADFEGFSLSLTAMCVTLHAEFSETLAEAYFEALSDLPAHAMAKAMKRAGRECEAFPKPIELRRFARAVLSDEENRRAMNMPALPSAFRQYAFLLAQLKDPAVPEWKKAKVRLDWTAKNPGQPGPWEKGGENQW